MRDVGQRVAEEARHPVAGEVLDDLIREAGGRVRGGIDARGIDADRLIAERAAQLLRVAPEHEQRERLRLVVAGGRLEVPQRLLQRAEDRQRDDVVLAGEIAVVGLARHVELGVARRAILLERHRARRTDEVGARARDAELALRRRDLAGQPRIARRAVDRRASGQGDLRDVVLDVELLDDEIDVVEPRVAERGVGLPERLGRAGGRRGRADHVGQLVAARERAVLHGDAAADDPRGALVGEIEPDVRRRQR